MFRKMRRYQQELSREECIDILFKGTSGVLAVQGDDDYPYAVPLSYVYQDDKIYFHCAKTGHKIDAIEKQNKVSFCIIDQDQVKPDEYTTYFRSVIVFGKARILSGDELRQSLEILAEKYTPDDKEGRMKEIELFIKNVCMVEIDIEHMSGKEAKELMQMKKQ